MNIESNECYLIGILLGKGSIVETSNQKVKLLFRVKFRRPTDVSLRADNIHTNLMEREFVESLKSKLSNDFSMIIDLLRNTWNINSMIDLPVGYSLNDWGMKEIVITTEEIDSNNNRLCEIFNVQKLSNRTLLKFPFHLNMEDKPENSLSFIQGVCDSCSLVPNEASSSFGGEGAGRIQLEPSQERWELPIGLCSVFQNGLGIRVNNINWGHPQIRGENAWKGQNHQFRVKLENIPNNIELYRLEYKRREYRNLYSRVCEKYKAEKLCPLKKKIKVGSNIVLHMSNDIDLNSELLDSRLRGISLDVSGKKGLLICKLLGCNRCKEYFSIEIKDVNNE